MARRSGEGPEVSGRSFPDGSLAQRGGAPVEMNLEGPSAPLILESIKQPAYRVTHTSPIIKNCHWHDWRARVWILSSYPQVCPCLCPLEPQDDPRACASRCRQRWDAREGLHTEKSGPPRVSAARLGSRAVRPQQPALAWAVSLPLHPGSCPCQDLPYLAWHTEGC